MTILVIDDESMIRTLAEKILQRAGHRVLLAESGNQGVDILRENAGQVDLLLIDMTMEGLSGEETLRSCRIIQPLIPAVFSSGHMLMKGDISPDLLTNTSFLQKPYRASDLVNKVESVFQTAKVPS